MTIDQLKTQSVEQLKALAYDQVKILDQTKYNLQIIESLIAEKSSIKDDNDKE